MRYLIADIAETGEVESAPSSKPARLVTARKALATEVASTIDPEFLTDIDISQVFPEGVACRFHYAGRSPAVLAVGNSAAGPAALIKISGDLVRLDGTGGADGGTFTAEGLSADIRPTDQEDMHDLILAADDYDAGFRGSYSCAD